MRTYLLLLSAVVASINLTLLTACAPQRPNPTAYPFVNTPGIATNRIALVQYLDNNGVQVIQRGGSLRLLLPTDQFFIGQSNEIDPDCIPLLLAAADLVKTYCCETVPYVRVTAYTDEVGTAKAKKERSEQQAQVVAAFLWARGIPTRIMGIKGYGQQEAISSNRIVGGSADNRRIEISIPQPFRVQGW